MKKTKLIKKTDVINALKTETLRRGNWFHETKYTIGFVFDTDCKVCAVGAILRKVSFEKWARKYGVLGILGNHAVNIKIGTYGVNGNYSENGKLALEDKNYLAALSNYFESGKSRKQCIAFVKKNFPVSFKLTIDIRGVTYE